MSDISTFAAEDGTLIKDFPLAQKVNDDDDFLIETSEPETEHIHADTIKAYMLNELFDSVYPVGAVYISTSSTSPASLFGGSWTQITNTFLVASGSDYTAGSTGGSTSVTLTASNIPSHSHSIPELSGTAASAGAHTHTGPSHSHSLPSHNHSLPSHTHSVNSHTHSIPALSGTAASAGAHCHTGNYAKDNTTGGSANRYYPDGANTSSGYLVNRAGAHTHSVTTSSSTTGSTSPSTGSTSGTSGNTSGTSGAAGDGATSSAGAHTHSVTISSTNTGTYGSGAAFNTVPPYYAVYMWRRTA